MKEFEFTEEDQIGEDTLLTIAEADKFNKWMYNTIKPFCKGKVLEIGSGLGNISEFFIEDDFSLLATDIREGYCKKLEEKFKEKPNFLGAEQIDLIDPEFDQKFKSYFNSFETVFALNVVEHIKDDQLAIINCKKLLKNEGHLIILVPSYQALYNKFDTELGHYRRYNLKNLSVLFDKASFKIINKQYFNLIGILGWYVSGSILKNEMIPKSQMTLYNSLVPIFKVIDKVIFNKIGLSTIVVGKK